jgi:hypothetical protein
MLLLLRPRNRYFASATLHPCLLLLPSMAIRSASIHTLSAANLTCEDFVSLDKYAKRAYVSCLNDKKKFAWITYGTEDFRVKPFPKGTQGFLYYAPGPKHAPIAGALRFRVTESRDPGAFHSGHNLIHHNGGTPWGITLLSLGTSRAIYRPLYDLLVSPKQPRLISDTLKDVLKTKTKITGTVVHSLGQPFMLDLSRSATICIASGHSVGPGINTPILGVQRHAGDGKLHYPYTGGFLSSLPSLTLLPDL